MKKTLLLFFMALLCNVVKAQFPYYEDDRLRFGVQIGADYDTPLGKLSFIYKPAISPNISLLLSKSERFSVNVTFGYHVYKPKATEFYYLIDDGENYGVDTFSEYRVKSAYLGFLYHIAFTDNIMGLAGLNFGLYNTDYESTSKDRQQSSISGFADKNVYGAPKAGFAINVTDAITWNIIAKYNIFSPTGNNSNLVPAVFHKELGAVYTTWAVGTGISYKF